MRGTADRFASVKELANTITSFLTERSDHPTRYVWRLACQRRGIQRAREAIGAPPAPTAAQQVRSFFFEAL
ncbi:hypothetical protein E4Q23_05560 [Candidatus Accumulibacter phosphatis]|uniref:Integrase n=1 Tax=Candidatus Accumulibacter phosphatis TaxID=327160 RepID=A0ABX1TSP7_9PROT|nr:hypothetical protein [Candidatus Accumulibacter phosphatis]NMQ27267.1 hypothetical protein [Candidatus Accumulibacter phosphatis]